MQQESVRREFKDPQHRRVRSLRGRSFGECGYILWLGVEPNAQPWTFKIAIATDRQCRRAPTNQQPEKSQNPQRVALRCRAEVFDSQLPQPGPSKRYSGLHLKDPGRNEVRAAKGRLEVIKSVLVCQVDNSEPQRHLCAFSTQKVVSPRAQIKHMTGSNSRRIGVVIRCTIGRNSYPQRTKRRRTATRQRVCQRSECAPTKETDLLLLICSET